MNGPCMCGDTYCRSCGPAQGNGYCDACGAWAADGGCVDPKKCEIENRAYWESFAAQVAWETEHADEIAAILKGGA